MKHRRSFPWGRETVIVLRAGRSTFSELGPEGAVLLDVENEGSEVVGRLASEVSEIPEAVRWALCSRNSLPDRTIVVADALDHERVAEQVKHLPGLVSVIDASSVSVEPLKTQLDGNPLDGLIVAIAPDADPSWLVTEVSILLGEDKVLTQADEIKPRILRMLRAAAGVVILPGVEDASWLGRLFKSLGRGAVVMEPAEMASVSLGVSGMDIRARDLQMALRSVSEESAARTSCHVDGGRRGVSSIVVEVSCEAALESAAPGPRTLALDVTLSVSMSARHAGGFLIRPTVLIENSLAVPASWTPVVASPLSAVLPVPCVDEGGVKIRTFLKDFTVRLATTVLLPFVPQEVGLTIETDAPSSSETRVLACSAIMSVAAGSEC